MIRSQSIPCTRKSNRLELDMFHSKKVNKGLSLLCHTLLHEHEYGHRDVHICMHVTVKGQTLIYVPLNWCQIAKKTESELAKFFLAEIYRYRSNKNSKSLLKFIHNSLYRVGGGVSVCCYCCCDFVRRIFIFRQWSFMGDVIVFHHSYSFVAFSFWLLFSFRQQ